MSSGMELAEAMERIRTSPADEQAWICIERHIRRTARNRKVIEDPGAAEDVAEEVIVALLKKATMGTLGHIDQPHSYLRRALYNRFISHICAQKPPGGTSGDEGGGSGYGDPIDPDTVPAPLPPDDTEPEAKAEAEAEQALLNRLIADATPPGEKRARAFQETVAEYLDRLSGKRTTSDLLRSRTDAAEGSPQWKTARDTLYKQHARAWERVADAARDAIASGELSEEDAARCHRLLTHTAPRTRTPVSDPAHPVRLPE